MAVTLHLGQPEASYGEWWPMNGKATLKRLERLARQRRGQPGIDTIEVWDGDELREVIPLPYRLYEVNTAGERVYVEPDEGELALIEKFRQLVNKTN